MSQKKQKNSELLGIKKFILITVTTVWAASFICDIILNTYSVPYFLHVIMMAVVGYLFKDFIKIK